MKALSPFFRKVALTAHITFSIGWFGAVTGFLALALAGLTNEDALLVRSAYLTMELIAWFVIVPFCFGTLLTGLIESLGTQWGLFRHYWVLVKFLFTSVATIILLVHMQPITYLADIASETTLANSAHRRLRIQLLADAGAAMLVLLVATTLSVYKPWGKTPYGQRKEREQNIPFRETAARKPWGLYILLGLISLVILLFIIMHLTGGGLRTH